MKLYSHYIKIKNIKIKSIAVLAVCSLFFSMGSGALTSFAHTPDESRFLNGTWEKDDHGWWFANKGNPDYFTSTWAEYQGYSYYFGADGYLVTGWNYINNHWYRFNPEKGSHEGAMMTGWIYDPDYEGWFSRRRNRSVFLRRRHFRMHGRTADRAFSLPLRSLRNGCCFLWCDELPDYFYSDCL